MAIVGSDSSPFVVLDFRLSGSIGLTSGAACVALMDVWSLFDLLRSYSENEREAKRKENEKIWYPEAWWFLIWFVDELKCWCRGHLRPNLQTYSVAWSWIEYFWCDFFLALWEKLLMSSFESLPFVHYQSITKKLLSTDFLINNKWKICIPRCYSVWSMKSAFVWRFQLVDFHILLLKWRSEGHAFDRLVC